MGQLAMVPANMWANNDFLHNYGVPDNYMGDFSVLGVVVDDYPKAMDMLEKNGFSIRRVGDGSLIGFNEPTAVVGILSLLHDEHIGFDYLDIATLYYQA